MKKKITYLVNRPLGRPWKYALHENGEEELFNLADDPYETENVADRDGTGSVAAELRRDLLNWCCRTGDRFGTTFDRT